MGVFPPTMEKLLACGRVARRVYASSAPLSASKVLSTERWDNNKGQTTVSDDRIGARTAREIAEANDYNESHC